MVIMEGLEARDIPVRQRTFLTQRTKVPHFSQFCVELSSVSHPMSNTKNNVHLKSSYTPTINLIVMG